MAAALVSGFLTFLLLRSGKATLLPVTPFMNVFNDFVEAMHAAGFHPSYDPKLFPWMDSSYKPIYAPSCQLVATSAFVVVLLLGHHMRAPVTMFLDKVCIHQTNPQKKAEGIQAIDQFLVRSKKMLICFNDDYFERLWCCFELAARASSGSAIEMLPLWRAPVVLAVLVGFTFSHVAEYVYILLAGVTPDTVNGFIAVSISFHAIPVLFMIEYTVLATRQKLKLTDTLKTFKIANTKCFDPSDRAVVERAISSWFASDGVKKSGDKTSSAGVDTRAIERFESDVREGVTNLMIMSSVGKQPGLLRVQDLLLIFYTVWIPSALDFSTHGVGRGNDVVCTFMFFISPIAQGAAFLVVAAVASTLPHWSKWLLRVILFFGFFIAMMIMMQTIFIFVFGVCQTACVLPVPF